MKRVKRKKSNVIRKSNKKIRNATLSQASDGTKFRSKLELFAYNKLLENGIKDFKYEELRFVLSEPFIYTADSYEADKKRNFKLFGNKIRAMTYKPDFTCVRDDKTGWIMETKGIANDAFPLRWKLFKKYLVENGYDITLYMPNTQTNVTKCVEMIKEKYYA